jgi:hypothetical protein
VSFDEAAAQPVVGTLGHVSVHRIGLHALLKNKRATGRTKDLADAEALEALRRSDA